MSFAFYLKRYYFDKTRNLSFAKKIPNLRQTQWKTRIPHTHNLMRSIQISSSIITEHLIFSGFSYSFTRFDSPEQILLWETIEKVRYDFAIDFGKTIVVCLKVNAHFKSSQPTNNPTRAHQFRSGGSALHRNACYRMFTCANKFCIKLYMQYAFIVCIILRCLFSPFVVVISMFAWFLRVLLTLYIYFVASLIFPGHTHLIHHINTAKKTNNAAAIQGHEIA